jgi:hypothetical protein
MSLRVISSAQIAKSMLFWLWIVSFKMSTLQDFMSFLGLQSRTRISYIKPQFSVGRDTMFLFSLVYIHKVRFVTQF